MSRLMVFLLGITLTVINGAKFSTLPTTVNITLGEDAFFTVTASDLDGEGLGWIVGETKVANLTSGSEGLVLNGGKTLDDSLYNVTTINNDTTLTVKSPNMTFNGAKVKLTDGTAESSISTLLITAVCGTLENGASASCSNVGCTATGQRNDTSTLRKYKKCVDSYTCEPDGNWTKTGESCTELICSESGKWGENCTMDCGDGCPTNMCFANGSCADTTHMNITACTEGYAGDKCDQQVIMKTSSSQVAPSTPSVSSSSTTINTATTTEATTIAPTSGCGSPPSVACSIPGENITKIQTCERIPGKKETCTEVWTCGDGEMWRNQISQCTFTCEGGRTWGPECRNGCGEGCRVNLVVGCDPFTGQCMDRDTGTLKVKGQCATGYKGDNCDQPICEEDCNGGVCIAPNYCGNCPRHYERGRTCRNLRLDGFLKGSLVALVVLTAVVVVLTLLSKWHIKNKIKEA